MGYLLTEIVVYLVIAGLIGFAFGWAAKAGALDKYSSKVKEAFKAYYLTLTTTKKVLKKEENEDVQKTEEPKKSVEEVAPVKVAEVIKEEIKVEEVKTEEPALEKVTEEVALEKVTEVIQEEIKAEEVKTEEPAFEETKEVELEVPTSVETVEAIVDTSKPTLLTEAPEKGADKLSSLKGIGPVLEKKLNALGVYTYEQIASWTTEQEGWIGTQMAFPKKVTKEEWVKQAKELLNAK